MLRYEKIDDGNVLIYRLHINPNYLLYIEFLDGKPYYGIWSEKEKDSNPISHLGDDEFEWDWRGKNFHLPNTIEEKALRLMRKLYAYYLDNKQESSKSNESVSYEQLWTELHEHILKKRAESEVARDNELDYYVGRKDTYVELAAYMNELIKGNK